MRTAGWNPSADCLQEPPKEYDRLHQMWVAVVLEIILELAEAYSVLNSNSSASDDTLISGLNQQMDQLNQKIDQVSQQLNDILGMIRNLPTLIRGAVTDAEIALSYQQANQVLGTIQDAVTSPAQIRQAPDPVVSSLNDVAKLIGGITGVGGASEILNSTPYFAGWLYGTIAYQKAMSEHDANWVITNPWKTKFWKKIVDLTNGFFTNVDQTDYDYDKVKIPDWPPHRQPVVLVNDWFWRPSPSRVGPIYLIHCSDGLSGERLQQPIPGFPGVWEDVRPDDPRQKDATGAFSSMWDLRSNILSFYATIPPIYAKKDLILRGLTEPPGFWSVRE
jgi:hypothetical protein